MTQLLIFAAVTGGTLLLLFIYAACVVSGRISESERQSEDSAKAQQEIENDHADD